LIAGEVNAREVRGQLKFMIDVPHLTNSLRAGDIVSDNDVELRPIALRYAKSTGLMTLDQLVGKQMKRSSRAGMMMRPSDVTEPEVIRRSDIVTIIFRQGPLSLSVTGQALNAAAKGESVSVLNVATKKIVHGIAIAPGTVEMINTNVQRVADLQS
jgi:flagella basal body P-ring formation protein FlgA